MSPMQRIRRFRAFFLALAATATLASVASAGVFSFRRTDYPLESYLNGLDSVAVADLDGKNGPDLVVESLTAGATATEPSSPTSDSRRGDT